MSTRKGLPARSQDLDAGAPAEQSRQGCAAFDDLLEIVENEESFRVLHVLCQSLPRASASHIAEPHGRGDCGLDK